MKKKIKKIISAVLLCAVLAGCSTVSPSHEIPFDQNSNCPISTMRTGTERQGLRTNGNSFECTQEGSYFMYNNPGRPGWLLYVDHNSDTIIKLCGRPDCNHTDENCNAFFYDAHTVCYYDGYLYTFTQRYDTGINNMDLIRMNLDGTDRQVIYNTSEFAAAHNYKDFSNHKIFNGVLFLMLGRIDENGDSFYDSAYYKLDGSMSEPKIDTFFTLSLFADGENIVGCVNYDRENDLRVVGIWDPDKGIVEELSKDSIVSASGYYGTKAHYYVEDGIIIEDSYTEGKKEFINTGHGGDYQLACFPDCIAMYEKGPFEEKIIYFYDWNGNYLDSLNIDYEFHELLLGFICGETPERIFLTGDYDCLPQYYINKSDIGTGNIKIHPLNLPDFGKE